MPAQGHVLEIAPAMLSNYQKTPCGGFRRLTVHNSHLGGRQGRGSCTSPGRQYPTAAAGRACLSQRSSTGVGDIPAQEVDADGRLHEGRATCESRS